MSEIDVLCLQETGLTDSGLSGVNSALRSDELQLLHSGTASWKRNSQGSWRADCGATPGVGILCSTRLDIRLAHTQTEECAKLIQKGRVCLAEIRTHAAPVLLAAVYFHSGALVGPLRVRMLQSLLAEIHLQARELVIVAGDYNEDWMTTPLAIFAAHDGLRQVLWQELRSERQFTYKCGNVKSCLDFVLVSTSVLQGCSRPTIDWRDDLQHALVVFHVACVKRMLVVKRVPRFLDCVIPSIDERVGSALWLQYEQFIDQLLVSGDVQSAYDYWVMGVRQLLFPDDQAHKSKGVSLPGHILRPVELGVGRKTKIGEGVPTSDVWKTYLMLEGRISLDLEFARTSLSALGLLLRVAVDTVLAAPTLYADEVRRAHRLYVREAKRVSIHEWRSRLQANWKQGGSLIYRWVKQKSGVLTLAILDDGKVLTTQREILGCLEQYWGNVFRHEHGDFEHLKTGIGSHGFLVDEQMVDAFQKKVKSIPRSKSGAMDGFNPSHFRALDKTSIRVLLRVISNAVRLHRWPRELLCVKLRLIPKVQSVLLEPKQFRPLSVAPLAFRSLEHVLMRAESLNMQEMFHKGQLGGVPDRSIFLGLVEVATCVAHALAFANTDFGEEDIDANELYDHCLLPRYGVLLDVKQFFDSLLVCDVVSVLRESGISSTTLAFLCTWYLAHVKFIHFAHGRGETAIVPGRGAPQGSYFSVLAANLLVARWLRLIESNIPRCQVWSAVDDRHVLTESMEQLQEALDLTAGFDAEQGWDLQLGKSQWWSTERECSALELCSAGKVVPHAESWVWLGAEFSTSGRKNVDKRNARFNAGIEILHRLQRAPFALQIKSTIAGTVACSRAVFGQLFHAPPKTLTTRWRTELRKTITGGRHMSSMPVLLALFHKPHQLDYWARVVYEVFAITRRVVECQIQLVPLWSSTWNMLRIPPCPLALLKQYCELLRWRWSSTPFVVYSPDDNVEHYREWNLLSCDVQAFLHEVRSSIRLLMLTEEGKRRKHLEGAGHALPDLTKHGWVKCQVSINLLNAFVTLVTDGLWCEQRRFAAGLRPTPSCMFCSEPWGTVHHVLWTCPQWSEKRSTICKYMDSHVDWPSCARLCGVATSTLPQGVLDEWTKVQSELAHIVLEYQEQSCALEKPCRGLITTIADDLEAEWVPDHVDHGVTTDVSDLSAGFDPVRTRVDRDCGEYLQLCFSKPVRDGRRLDFSVCEPRGDLSGQGGGWLYSRAAWITLLRYLSSLRVCESDSVAPTFLELYLDYLCETALHRWPTGIEDSDGGGLWCSQLAGFRTALSAFERLCSPAPPVVPSKRSACTTNRLAVFGLPVLECTLAKGIRVRNPHHVKRLLDEASGAIAEARLKSAVWEKWRLWSPGLPQSQMLVE
eukprot:3760095-Amphidinium_carterae.1